MVLVVVVRVSVVQVDWDVDACNGSDDKSDQRDEKVYPFHGVILSCE